MLDQSGLSRRELLKRGAALGGALLWTTPLIQAIGMSPAFAQQASASPCSVFYAIKVGKLGVCENISTQDLVPSAGKCLDVVALAGGSAVSNLGCAKLGALSQADERLWTIGLPSCDILNIGVKLGGGSECDVSGPGPTVIDPGRIEAQWDASTKILTVQSLVTQQGGISHVEIFFCCSS